MREDDKGIKTIKQTSPERTQTIDVIKMQDRLSAALILRFSHKSSEWLKFPSNLSAGQDTQGEVNQSSICHFTEPDRHSYKDVHPLEITSVRPGVRSLS